MTTTYNIDDIKITLPSIEMLSTRSLFSDNNYGYGKKSALTDFAILTGNFYEGYTEDYTLKDRTGSYYTTTYIMGNYYGKNDPYILNGLIQYDKKGYGYQLRDLQKVPVRYSGFVPKA